MGSSPSSHTGSQTNNRGLSPLYQACRDGNVYAVQEMLSTLSYEQINQLEPNGSTALHAACYYNHPRIVKLLLDSGCARTVLNHYGKTPFEEAASKEVRDLFKRPTSNRFVDDDGSATFSLRSSTGGEVKMNDGIPDDWVKGYTSADAAAEAHFMLAFVKEKSMRKNIIKRQIESKSTQDMHKVMKETVPIKQHTRAHEFFSKFLNKTGVSNLVRLYTMETPLYRYLHDDADHFISLLYLNLDQLQNRAFRGVTFRGVTMAKKDIEAYLWAMKHPDYVLETRTLQSTTVERGVARDFIQQAMMKPENSDKYAALFIIHFPETCATAIDLRKISQEMPALSEYENENEVLMLPFTLFSVTSIIFDQQHREYQISLKNVPIPEESLKKAADRVKAWK